MMTENQKVPGRKSRSSEQIKRLVVEFEASGLRQNEFCRNHGLALSTLQRQLKKPGRSILCFGQLPLLGSFPDTQSGSRSERCSRSSPLQFVARDSKETFLMGSDPVRERSALNVDGTGLISLAHRVRTEVGDAPLYDGLVFF